MSDRDEHGSDKEDEKLVEEAGEKEGYVAGRRTTAVGDMLRGGGGGGSKRFMDMTEQEEKDYRSYQQRKGEPVYPYIYGGKIEEFEELPREVREKMTIAESKAYMAAKTKHTTESNSKYDLQQFLKTRRVPPAPPRQPVKVTKPVKLEIPRASPPARLPRLTLPEWTALLTEKVEALLATGRYNRKTAQYMVLENDDRIKEEIDWVKTFKEREEAEEAKRKSGRRVN